MAKETRQNDYKRVFNYFITGKLLFRSPNCHALFEKRGKLRKLKFLVAAKIINNRGTLIGTAKRLGARGCRRSIEVAVLYGIILSVVSRL